MRPYTDLIKEIEFNNQKFVPLKMIAYIATGYPAHENIIKHSEFDIIKQSDSHMQFEFHIKNNDNYWHEYTMTILNHNLDIMCSVKSGNDYVSVRIYDQVAIFKLLTQWGFIQ